MLSRKNPEQVHTEAKAEYPPKKSNGLAVISCHYGGYNELRWKATTRAVWQWNRQSTHPCEALFIELVCPDETPCFTQFDFPNWLTYIRINGKKRNKNIFQKEALWNIAARLTSAQNILFVDADVYPENCTDWFERLEAAAECGTVTHPCTLLIEEGWGKGGGDITIISAMASSETKTMYNCSGVRAFPGLGYLITRKDFNSIGGFNQFGITGSGDSVFLYECCPSARQPFGYAHRYHESILRKGLPQFRTKALNGVTIRHSFHGAMKDRAYQWSREVISLLGIPRAMCHIDHAGLTAWNDPECLLAQICNSCKSRMKTKDELLGLIMETASKRLEMLTTDKLVYNPEDYNDD